MRMSIHHQDKSESSEGMWITLIAVTILASYSLIINVAFGHKTFWRNSMEYVFPSRSWKLLERVSRWSSRFLSSDISAMYSFATPLPKILQLDESVLIYTFDYLTPADILRVGKVNQYMRRVARSDEIWRRKWSQVINKFSPLLSHPSPLNILPLRESVAPNTWRDKFFQFCEHFREEILAIKRPNDTTTPPLPREDEGEDEGEVNDLRDGGFYRIMIDADIYELKEFLPQHPGGAAILSEWRGLDASHIFHMAAHSRSAKTMAKSMIIWNHMEVMGRKGWPASGSAAK